MKMKRTLKRLAAVLMLAAGILGLALPAAADEIVQVFGSKNQLLGTYPATSVGTIAFAEAPDTIVIPLTDDVKFTMIKVDGGVSYTLRNEEITWTQGQTKQIDDFWIGKFEVTQGLWKAVMDITEFPNEGAGARQSATDNDNLPVACVSWDDITGENGFLSNLNNLSFASNDLER